MSGFTQFEKATWVAHEAGYKSSGKSMLPMLYLQKEGELATARLVGPFVDQASGNLWISHGHEVVMLDVDDAVEGVIALRVANGEERAVVEAEMRAEIEATRKFASSQGR